AAEGRVKRIVVAGCLSQRFGDKLAKQIKEVDLFTGTGRPGDIPSLIGQGRRGASLVSRPSVSYPEAIARYPYGDAHSVYVKIADGCSNRCSYCVIPFIKGGLRSRKTEDVVSEAKALVDRGAVELNIVAQDTLNFGTDRGGSELIGLLSSLEKVRGLRWIRLNYLYPSHITDGLLDFIGGSEKVVEYFDVPIQHISDRILRLMNRTTSSRDIKDTVDRIWKRIKDPFLRTTVITGFPGETEEDFRELMAFFGTHPFHRIGVFPYSREEPAPASRLKDQVPQHTITERLNRMNDLAGGIMLEASSDFVDRTYESLIEGQDPSDQTTTLARPWFLAPEIDGYVLIHGRPAGGKGQFADVRITDAIGVDLVGELV
ncbi:MAG: MiaB/RimO family radical SAM methylthiotransferase, partial [Deltaproteobacteria bacterium]|nr:MiaB/RimO family radical SAM methylthiotransferase [Deltaproteobacteria bacterium]